MNRTHKKRNGEPTATFDELSFAEQAKSINATVNVLSRMIDSNVRRGGEEDRNVIDILDKRVGQIERMAERKRTQ